MEQLLPVDKIFGQQQNRVNDFPFRVVSRNTEEYILGGESVEVKVLHIVEPPLKSCPEDCGVGAGVEEM